MRLIYTDHLKTRLKQREISLKLVKEIFNKNKENYYAKLRKHHIIISSSIYKGKRRKVLAAYDTIKRTAEVITVHPITNEQIEHRINSGRWIYETN